MSLRNYLLDHLSRLLPTQLSELLVKLDDENSRLQRHIPTEKVAPSDIAQQLIQVMEHRPEGLLDLCSSLDKPFNVLYPMVEELEILFERLQVDEAVLHQAYSSTVDELFPLRLYIDGKIDIIFKELLNPPYSHHTGEYPLLHFVIKVITQLGDNKDELLDWLTKKATSLDLSRKDIKLLLDTTRKLSTPDSSLRYILVELHPAGKPVNSYTIQAWFTDSKGKGRNVLTKAGVKNTELSEYMPVILAELLGNAEIRAQKRYSSEHLHLEFFLPLDLLTFDLDIWTPNQDKTWSSPLSKNYRLVVRVWERFRDESSASLDEQWCYYWNKHLAALCQPADQSRTVWLRKPKNTRYHSMLEKGNICFFLCFSPNTQDLERFLTDGIGIMLWSRQKLSRKKIEEKLFHKTVEHLPEVVRACRAEHKGETCFDTGALQLLWDDPHRLPREAPLTDQDL